MTKSYAVGKSLTTPNSKIAAKTAFEVFGTRIHELLKVLPDAVPITDTLDYLLGALHGLKQAADVGFRDRPSRYVDEYRPWLAQYALDIAFGKPLNRLWEGGLYFNSGIQRLAALFDRIPKLLQAPEELNGKSTTAKIRMKYVNRTVPASWGLVYDEINAFKHSPEGRALGRKVETKHALAAFDELLTLLESKVTELSKLYAPPPKLHHA
jgi:hypothetical protein